MCDHCEENENIPPGGSLQQDEIALACPKQIAECLRDTIRAAGGDYNDHADEMDLYINELVDRILHR